MVKAAAIQLEPRVGDVEANLDACEGLANEAGAAGAGLIVLPEFFTTGVGFLPSLARAALPPDGPATTLLLRLAERHGALVGGSFLCRDADGHARNAFLLASPEGLLGRHDKDLPTMWENCFYVGGSDDGVIGVNGFEAGVALCWELMRTQTARRLRGRVDVVVGGSCWWSVPEWTPRRLSRRLERSNARTAAAAPPAFARLVGAPVVHAAHSGPLECGIPWAPGTYRGHFQGGAVICDAAGRVLARREADQGPGVAIADIEPARAAALDSLPDRFWLHRRGALSAFFWSYQRAHGRRWYARHGAGLPPLPLQRTPAADGMMDAPTASWKPGPAETTPANERKAARR